MARINHVPMAVITRRWLSRTFGLIALFMALVLVSLSIALHSFYYNAVRGTLSSGFNSIVSRYFSTNAGASDEDFNRVARAYIESYGARDTVNVWVIDRHGKVVSTSDGFRAPEGLRMTDYETALQSDARSSEWIGYTDGGEKIMAMTFLLEGEPGSRPALRFTTSLEKVDRQYRNDVFLLILVSAAAILLALVPSTFYIDRLVRAVRNTTTAADKIAKGDYNTRIDYAGKDEIGELCTAVSNMAKEISAADTMKNEFISTVSHELRTPLTAIRGWGETLRQVGSDDAALTQRGVDVILSETSRLGGMVEELLDFSRMRGGKLSLRVSPMDGVRELDEAVLTFRARAEREGKRFLYEAHTAEAPMRGDETRIMQVFVNVIDNALKYTEPGGTVRIESAVRGQKWHILVSDTGRGIAPQDLPHVKEKFYKADTTVRGSGIGLAVADEIVRMHSGSLEIDSEHGSGTTVQITLPLSREDERSTDNGKA